MVEASYRWAVSGLPEAEEPTLRDDWKVPLVLDDEDARPRASATHAARPSPAHAAVASLRSDDGR